MKKLLCITIILAGLVSNALAQKGHNVVLVKDAPPDYVKGATLEWLHTNHMSWIILSEEYDQVRVAGQGKQVVYYFERQGSSTLLSLRRCGGERGDDCENGVLPDVEDSTQIERELLAMASEFEHAYAPVAAKARAEKSKQIAEQLAADRIHNDAARHEADSLRPLYLDKDVWLLERNHSDLPFLSRYKVVEVQLVREEVSFATTDSIDNVMVILRNDSGRRFSEASQTIKEKYSLRSPSKLHPTWSKKVWDAIANNDVFVGMNKEQVRMSWGEPSDINSTTSKHASSEQWVFGSGSYLYFDGNQLTTIQH